ncbi:MAG: hypothetical protein AAB362_00315 [Patescibacteria group bacterium]
MNTKNINNELSASGGKKHASCFTVFNNRGQIVVPIIVFSALSTILIGGLVQWAALHIKATRQLSVRGEAVVVAEAGAEYYRWHLAHAPQDFQDGTGGPGPYTHSYYDKNGVQIGTFSLTITPPPIGSTLVTVLSEGVMLANPLIKRKIRVQFAVPSWAKYAFAADDFMRFGPGTEVFGEIYSNKGIRFDGLAHNLLSSAVSTFDDPDHPGGNEFGVHTHVSPIDPLPPATVPNRADIFLAGRKFPVPQLDFAGLTADLSALKTKAQAGGRYFANSGTQGYNIVLKTNDTFDLYRVTSVLGPPGGCGSTQSKWGTWSILAQTLLGNYTFPANGIIFVEDNFWIEGRIDGARLNIVSARFPENVSTNTSITINKNVTYTRYDGADVLGLIAQENINIGLKSNNALLIDGALVAKTGRIGRYYYGSSCGPEYIRSSITLTGAITTSKRYGFAYTDGTGYQTRVIIYDANLLYAPPPDFPLTSDQYSVVSWEEVE